MKGNIVRACQTQDLSTCSDCPRSGAVLMNDWNEWDCSNKEATMIYITNYSGPIYSEENKIIGCEVEVYGSLV